jgi:hypothetical protein
MLLQGWKHENHWVPNMHRMKGGPTLANRTSAANCCAMCSRPLVWKRITISLKRHIFSCLASYKHFSMMTSTVPADGVTLTFFLGERDSFHSMVDLLLVGVNEGSIPHHQQLLVNCLPSAAQCCGLKKKHHSSRFVVTCQLKKQPSAQTRHHKTVARLPI